MIDLVLCASGSDEVRIVHAIASDHASEVRVVRRCADLAETLAVVAAGIGDAVLIDIDVRGLDRDTVAEMLGTAGAVVGLARDDGAQAPAPSRLGLTHVLASDAEVPEILTAIAEALETETDAEQQWVQMPEPAAATGRIVAVWGPAGAPGRTTVAANLAQEAALAGTPVILVDADTYGPSLAQVLGVLDDAPGLIAACRASARDTLDEQTLAGLVPAVGPDLRLLSGIGVAARWPEIRPSALEGVWDALASTGALVIVDVGFCLEEDEELSYDTMAPRRNAAAVSAVARADTVLAVVSADPVSITRLLREAERLTELEVEDLRVVINRVGPPAPADRVRELVATRIPVRALMTLPDDPGLCRRAAWAGEMLSEAGARTSLRRGMRELAETLLPPGTDAQDASARGSGAPSPARTRRRGILR